jgi:hypothetical protein
MEKRDNPKRDGNFCSPGDSRPPSQSETLQLGWVGATTEETKRTSSVSQQQEPKAIPTLTYDSRLQDSGAGRKPRAQESAAEREEIVPGVGRQSPTPVSTAGKKKKRKTRKRPSKREIRDSQTKIAIEEIIRLGRKFRLLPYRFIRAHLMKLGISNNCIKYALTRLRNKYADGLPLITRKVLDSAYGRGLEWPRW